MNTTRIIATAALALAAVATTAIPGVAPTAAPDPYNPRGPKCVTAPCPGFGPITPRKPTVLTVGTASRAA